MEETKAMKPIKLILLLSLALAAASPALAGAGAAKPANQPSAWSRIRKGVAADWKKIGKDAKESGVAAGRKIKKEFKQLPADFRKGVEETKQSFKRAIGSSNKANADKGK
jgi:hypothetical protein